MTELDYKGSDVMIRGLALFRRRHGVALEIRSVKKGLHVREAMVLAREEGLAVQDAIYDRVVTLRGDEGLRTLNRYVRLSTAAFALLALIGIVLAPVAIAVFFGRQYRGAVLPLQLLLADSALIGVAVITSTYLVGHLRRPGVLSWLAAGGAVVAIVLGVFFTRRWEIIGAAVALLLTQILMFLAASTLYARWSRNRFVDFLIVGARDFEALRASLQRTPREERSADAPPPEATRAQGPRS